MLGGRSKTRNKENEFCLVFVFHLALMIYRRFHSACRWQEVKNKKKTINKIDRKFEDGAALTRSQLTVQSSAHHQKFRHVNN